MEKQRCGWYWMLPQALAVADRRPVPPMDFGAHLGQCRYFTADRHDGAFTETCGQESFRALLITEGEGNLDCGGVCRTVKKGECYFMPAGSGTYCVSGKCQCLTAYVA